MNTPPPVVPATPALPRQILAAFWILLAASTCLLVLARLVTWSFFFDGNIYASTARNMAEGLGSAWSLNFSRTLFPIFAEHPPLMMWLEAVGFVIFGDTIAVEKGFSLLTFLAAGFILFKIWMRLNGNDAEMQRGAPFALLMTLIAGRINWAFGNGMLENLLIVLTSLAVFFVVTAYDERRRASLSSRAVLMGAAGLAIALAVLTKGPVGLFPLAAPGLYWLSLKRPSFRAAAWDSLILLAVVALFYIILWSFEASRESLQRYLNAQLLPSLAGERGFGGGGWTAVRTLIRVNAYPLIAAAVIIVIAGRRQTTSVHSSLGMRRKRRAAYLFLLGCSASLPLLVSPRVASFYFNPSLAYFAAALSIFCVPLIYEGLSKCGPRLQRCLYLGSVGLLAISLATVGWSFGRLGKDWQIIEAAEAISSVVCTDRGSCPEMISACGSALEDWALYAYMQRYYKISIANAAMEDAKYLIADDSCQSNRSYTNTDVVAAPYRLLRLD